MMRKSQGLSNGVYLVGLCFLLLPSIIDSQSLGKIIDNLACRRTSSRGYHGECVERCSSSSAVSHLCLNSNHICCYGSDICNEQRNRYPLVSVGSQPEYPLNDNYDGSCNRWLVSRRDWQAEPASRRASRLPPNLDHIIIHHTDDDHDACFSFEDCRLRLREIQSYYQNQKAFPDIPWNFLISQNGEVFEGVGWYSQGYHTENWNDRSIGIAFMGDFDLNTPSTRAMRALNTLLDCGFENGFLSGYYRLYGHRDVRSTECPGDYLYDAIRRLSSFKHSKNGILTDDYENRIPL